MKIPFLTTEVAVLNRVQGVLEALNDTLRQDSRRVWEDYQVVPLGDVASAIEFINYDMPQLIFVDFSNPTVDGFHFIERMIADPWLNNGGVVAFYKEFETLERINGLGQANIIITFHTPDIESQLLNVMNVIKDNERILFHRAFQQDFLSDITGNFVLDMDVLLVSVYANLVANYLYNMDFVAADAKSTTALCLTEILVNAIEHGSCGITAAEKKAHLAQGKPVQSLIDDRLRDAAIARRKVHFSYSIRRGYSEYVIRDEGTGFDWRPLVDPARELDLLSEQGRGIWIAVNSLDQVRYNEQGNEVNLRIRHRRNTANTIPEAFRSSEAVNFEPEEVVFRQGEESNFIYYVAEGVYRVEVNGKQVATVDPSDILIGEMSFLLQDTRSATVVANTAGKLIRISKESFVHSLKNRPYYGLFLAKLLAKRLLRSSRGIIN